MNWLNAIDTEDEENIEKNTSEGTGLLLAPLSQQPVNELAFPVVNVKKSPEPEQHEPGEVESIMQELQSWKNELHDENISQDFHPTANTENIPQDFTEADNYGEMRRDFHSTANPDEISQDFTGADNYYERPQNFRSTASDEELSQDFTEADDYEEISHDFNEKVNPAEIHHGFTGADNYDKIQRDFHATVSDEEISHDFIEADTHNETSHELQDWQLDTHNEPETSEFVLKVDGGEEIIDDDNADKNDEEYDNETSEISHELHDLQEAVKNLQVNLDADVETETEDDAQETHEQTETPSPQLNPDWRNANTGFELSLDEPPPEIWTKINAEKENPEELNYEATSSLQGAAYIPKPEHGKNFTQRLQKTLQNRKQKAEAERELEAEHQPHHPYLQKTMIICGTLLIVLFFVWLGLWFMQRETPEGMNARAEKLYEQGNFDEAEKLYQRAYQRYPNVLTFLAKFADSAEKAGHSQTAEAAKREYARNFPDEQSEIIILNEKKGDDEQSKQENSEQKPERVKTEPVKITQPVSVYHDEKLTFDEYLQEGTHAFNVGMYNRAVINFFRAYDINSNDPRPYIGLAGAYRAKGLYFDAKVILDEARKKFRRNPTLEMERQFLREAR